MGFRKKLSIIALFLVTSLNLSFAQQPLSREKWEELTEELDYGELKNPEIETEEDTEADDDGSAFDLPDGLIQILVISALIIGLTLLLVKILSNRFNNEKVETRRSVESLEEAENEVDRSDLLPLFNQFLNSGNYRLALRILYLRILQELHRQELIHWKKEKTNFDYVRELSDDQHRRFMASLTMKFERKWYGEQEITEKEFFDLRPHFESFIQKLTGNE